MERRQAQVESGRLRQAGRHPDQPGQRLETGHGPVQQRSYFEYRALWYDERADLQHRTDSVGTAHGLSRELQVEPPDVAI